MKTMKLFLLTIFFSFAVMAQRADSRLLRFTVEGVVGPDVPKCPIGAPSDSALYAPLTNKFSEGDHMKMTFTVDMSISCDPHVESVPAGDPDGGHTCYYNGSVVALTMTVGDYRCDYGKADPYLYPVDKLTYDPVNFGYAEDLFQYTKIHDEKWSPDINNCAGMTVDHLMLEHRILYGTGPDLILTGTDYYDGDLGGTVYTYKVTGCSFAVTGEHSTMFDSTSLPESPVAIDTSDPQIYPCRWALLFGRSDKIEAGIQHPYKVQGVLTSYYAEPDPDTSFDTGGGCFIATAAYGTRMAKEIKILEKFRDNILLSNHYGKAIVNFYYKVSPSIADFIGKHDILRAIVRIGLLPVVGISWIVLKLGIFTTIIIFFSIGLISFAGFRKFRSREI